MALEKPHTLGPLDVTLWGAQSLQTVKGLDTPLFALGYTLGSVLGC